MCKMGTTKRVYVKIPEDLSCTGFTKFQHEDIDECIANIVNALQVSGVDMRGCCCGHGKGIGDIQLQDGRSLLIVDSQKYFKNKEKVNKIFL